MFRQAFKNILSERLPSSVIEEAANGDEASQKIKATLPHLIFMDIRLPGLNGFQLTQKIKAASPGIHIAILTGYDLPEYRQAALEHGADRFFVKESLKWDEIEAFVKSIPLGGTS